MSFSYFKSNIKIDGESITNVDITSSTLDMNNNTITSVANPVNPQDAATKAYVDLVGEIVTITLTGTSYTSISSKTRGSVILIVESTSSDGPTATFNLSKSKNTKLAHIIRTSAAPGDSVNKEQLDVKWDISSGIELRKTDVNFDGTYRVKIF